MVFFGSTTTISIVIMMETTKAANLISNNTNMIQVN